MNEQPFPNREIEELLVEYHVIKKVIAKIKEKCPQESLDRAGVSYLSGYISQGEVIRNALEKSEDLEHLRIRRGRGVLLLVDTEPQANWAHRCWIATYDLDSHETQIALSNFPPKEEPERRLVRASHQLTTASAA